jgi:ligand-binding sensor protein
VKSDLIRALSDSEIFRDYERAFSSATGLPLSISAPGSWQLVHQGKKTQNRFCEIMSETNCSCASCLEMQEKLRKGGRESAKTERCAMGMVDSAVPLKMGSEVIGFLQTGQVFCRKPTAAQFSRIAKKLQAWGIEPDARIEKAYFETKVMTPAQ